MFSSFVLSKMSSSLNPRDPCPRMNAKWIMSYDEEARVIGMLDYEWTETFSSHTHFG